MLREDELYRLLDEQGVSYRVVRHAPVLTVDAALAEGIAGEGSFAKNLFLRDDKHRAYYLVSASIDAKIDLRLLASRLGSRRLSFASEVDLGRMLGVAAGAVTPLAILNDEARRVQMVFDASLRDAGTIGVHPLVNTATVFLRMTDLVALIERMHGPVSFVSLGEGHA